MSLRHQFRQIKRFFQGDFDGKVSAPLSTRLNAWRMGYHTENYLLCLSAGVDPAMCISDWDRIMRLSYLNGYLGELLRDKSIFDQYMSCYMRTARNFGVVLSGKFFATDSAYAKDDLCGLLDRMQEGPGLVLKPVEGGKGKHVCVIRFVKGEWTFNGSPRPREELLGDLPQGILLIACEFVQQAMYADKIYPWTCNTVRVVTMIDPETKESFVAAVTHRFGNNKSRPVDNMSSGGCFSRVEIETGILGRAALVGTNGSVAFTDHHPDTHETITGVQIPGFHQMLKNLLEYSQEIGRFPLLAWDIAMQDDGFTVIELNPTMGYQVIELHGPLWCNPKVAKVLSHYGVKKTVHV